MAVLQGCGFEDGIDGLVYRDGADLEATALAQSTDQSHFRRTRSTHDAYDLPLNLI